MPLPLLTTSGATQRARGGPRRPPLPPLLPLPPLRLGRRADELTKPARCAGVLVVVVVVSGGCGSHGVY